MTRLYIGKLLNYYIQIDSSITDRKLGCKITKSRRMRAEKSAFFKGVFLLCDSQFAVVNEKLFVKITDVELSNMAVCLGIVGNLLVFVTRDKRCWGYDISIHCKDDN